MSGLSNVLPGSPATAQWGQRYTPASLLGLQPGTGSKAAGAALPPSTATSHDNVMVPWSPDSPTFWLVAFVGLTVLGVTGASVKVRAFKRHASVNVGDA